MMHGLVHDSMVVGTAKRVAHAGHHKPRRRTRESKPESAVLGILTIVFSLFA